MWMCFCEGYGLNLYLRYPKCVINFPCTNEQEIYAGLFPCRTIPITNVAKGIPDTHFLNSMWLTTSSQG